MEQNTLEKEKGGPDSTSQIVLMPIDDLMDPDWNPRPILDEAAMKDLEAHLRRGKYVPPIWVWKGDGQKPLKVISGKRRREAARRVGMTHIEAILMDIPLDEAKDRAFTSNRDDKPYWLGEYINVESRYAELGGNYADLGDRINRSKSWVGQAILMAKLLNPASRKLIFDHYSISVQSLDGNSKSPEKTPPGTPKKKGRPSKNRKKSLDPWVLEEYTALNLLPLLTGRPEIEASMMAERLLPLILSEEFNGPQISGLVAHVISGGDHATFQPSAKGKGASKDSGKSVNVKRFKSEDQDQAEETSTDPKDSNPLHLSTFTPSPKEVEPQITPTDSTSSPGVRSAAHINDSNKIEGIRQKVRVGISPTTKEHLAVAGHYAGKGLRWVGEKILWLIKEAFHLALRLTRDALKTLAHALGPRIYRVAKGMLAIVFLALLVWAAWNALFHAGSVTQKVKQVVMWPIRWIGEKVEKVKGEKVTTTTIEPPTIGEKGEKVKKEKVATITTELKDSKPLHLSTFPLLTKNVSPPVTNAVVPWTPDLEDRGIIEAETDAVRESARIVPVPIQPVPMSGDMSIRRLGDLQDAEKYSLIVGRDKQHVLSVSPAMTGFTLTYGDGLPIGGPSKIEFYWEDVKAIHCDEVKSGTRTLYQMALVVNTLKKPFIVQCPTAEGLGHLVSAFEFWIGAAGAGRKAPITGMPYLFQGLMLDSQCRVKLVWAGSPADIGVVQPGDGFWSWDVDAKQAQGKAYLESALESPTPGRHSLYVSTSDAWGGGPLLGNAYRNRPFNPKRQRMEMEVP